MQRDFSLEAIFTITTGINFNGNLDEVCELASFVYNDVNINRSTFDFVKEEVRQYLLTIHPEINGIFPSSTIENNPRELGEWIRRQKSIFGDTLSVSRLGQPLGVVRKLK